MIWCDKKDEEIENDYDCDGCEEEDEDGFCIMRKEIRSKIQPLDREWDR